MATQGVECRKMLIAMARSLERVVRRRNGYLVFGLSASSGVGALVPSPAEKSTG